MSNAPSTFERLRAHVAGAHARDVPLAQRTSIRVGGPAELFVQPADAQALALALQILADDGVPHWVLGGGANTLVGDGGIPGAVIRLPSGPEQLTREDGGVMVTLPAGAPIAKLIQVMRREAVTGAEFLAGVPGTLGGAVAMNAGTQKGWVQTVLREVELASAQGVTVRAHDELSFAYRHTTLPMGSVLTRATFFLPFGDTAASEAQMARDLAYRRGTQPLSQPNFGSCFVNPEGSGAGRLIEQVGLKGQRLGAAQISDVHANFIVNLGGAQARDVRGLLHLAQARVREQTGVELVHEVKFAGEF